MEGLGATVGERGICSDAETLMIWLAFQEEDLACASVPEVRAVEEETEAMHSWDFGPVRRA